MSCMQAHSSIPQHPLELQRGISILDLGTEKTKKWTQIWIVAKPETGDPPGVHETGVET